MPRKGENIYKRKDGRWEGRYIKSRTPDDKTHYGYVYAKSYKELKLKLQKFRHDVIEPPDQREISTDIDFRTLSQSWLSSKKTQIKESREPLI